jgi:hypothetical protein
VNSSSVSGCGIDPPRAVTTVDAATGGSVGSALS